MCEFVTAETLMPGLICCRCRGYNGLQRYYCKDCGMLTHQDAIPPHIQRCGACGFGFREDGSQVGQTMAGRKIAKDTCPACGSPYVPKSKVEEKTC